MDGPGQTRWPATDHPASAGWLRIRTGERGREANGAWDSASDGSGCGAAMIRAVIFDFNGVLVDDEPVHFALFRAILAREGIALDERRYHERYLGYDDR